MTAAPQIAVVRLDQVRESKYHCRRNWGDMVGLAQSIREHGVLELPSVRRLQITSVPNAPIGEDEPLEILFGHRRKRGAALADLTHIVVIVRENISEEEAIELQMVENVQRHDLHPLDEGLAYARLVELGRTVEEIAAHVGRSKTTVHGRIALAGLPKATQDALAEGRMLVGVGLLIARLPATQWEGATKALTPMEEMPAMPVGVAAEIIRQRFACRLDAATFPRGDKKLLPIAGPCTKCSKRTDVQGALFDEEVDLSGHRGDQCLDPKCYHEKTAAHFAREAQKADVVLPPKEAKEVFSYGGGVRHDAAYVVATEVVPGSETTWEKAAKEQGVKFELAVAKAPNGAPVKLMPREAAKEIAQRAGADFDLGPSREERIAQSAEANAERERVREANERFRTAAREHIVSFYEKSRFALSDLRWIVLSLFDSILDGGAYDVLEATFKRRLWNDGDHTDRIDKLSEAEMRGLLAEIAFPNVGDEDLRAWLEDTGFSLEAIELAANGEPAPASTPAPRAARGRKAVSA